MIITEKLKALDSKCLPQ